MGQDNVIVNSKPVGVYPPLSPEGQEDLQEGQFGYGMVRRTEYSLGGVWTIVSFVVVFSCGMSMLPAETVANIFKENGIIETVSAVGLLAASGWLFLYRAERQT